MSEMREHVKACKYEKVRNVFSGLCILTCVGESDITTILVKCHGLWSNSLLPHGISVSDGVFAFTHLTRSEKQYQTGLRPLVCSQPEFATPFTLVTHQSHIWKKKEKHIYSWNFILPLNLGFKNIFFAKLWMEDHSLFWMWRNKNSALSWHCWLYMHKKNI